MQHCDHGIAWSIQRFFYWGWGTDVDGLMSTSSCFTSQCYLILCRQKFFFWHFLGLSVSTFMGVFLAPCSRPYFRPCSLLPWVSRAFLHDPWLPLMGVLHGSHGGSLFLTEIHFNLQILSVWHRFCAITNLKGWDWKRTGLCYYYNPLFLNNGTPISWAGSVMRMYDEAN